MSSLNPKPRKVKVKTAAIVNTVHAEIGRMFADRELTAIELDDVLDTSFVNSTYILMRTAAGNPAKLYTHPLLGKFKTALSWRTSSGIVAAVKARLLAERGLIERDGEFVSVKGGAYRVYAEVRDFGSNGVFLIVSLPYEDSKKWFLENCGSLANWSESIGGAEFAGRFNGDAKGAAEMINISARTATPAPYSAGAVSKETGATVSAPVSEVS